MLKAAEESGRARRGYFVEGLGAAQFALPGAVDRLRAEARPVDVRARRRRAAHSCSPPPTRPTPTARRCRGPQAARRPSRRQAAAHQAGPQGRRAGRAGRRRVRALRRARRAHAAVLHRRPGGAAAGRRRARPRRARRRAGQAAGRARRRRPGRGVGARRRARARPASARRRAACGCGAEAAVPEGDTVWLTAHRLHRALAGRALTRFDFRVPALATADLRGRTVHRGAGPRQAPADPLRRRPAPCTATCAWTAPSTCPRAGGRPPAPAPRAHDPGAARQRRVAGHRLPGARPAPRHRAPARREFVGHLGPDLLGPDWDAERAVANLLRAGRRRSARRCSTSATWPASATCTSARCCSWSTCIPWTPVGRASPTWTRWSRTCSPGAAGQPRPSRAVDHRLPARGREHWVYERGGQPCLRCRTPIQPRRPGRAAAGPQHLLVPALPAGAARPRAPGVA